jgi:hypothetical protein
MKNHKEYLFKLMNNYVDSIVIVISWLFSVDLLNDDIYVGLLVIASIDSTFLGHEYPPYQLVRDFSFTVGS